MYRVGPAFHQFTQHAQAWAVLNGLLPEEKAAEALGHSFEEDVLKCRFSTCHEFFRACEKAGCYGLTKELMDLWISLPDKGCTTCPETPDWNTRSECHAWSAQPMYELIHVMAGIQPLVPGYGKVFIKPHLDYLPDLSGNMITEFGPIAFHYVRTESGIGGSIVLPEGMSGVFEAYGKTVTLHEGENRL